MSTVLIVLFFFLAPILGFAFSAHRASKEFRKDLDALDTALDKFEHRVDIFMAGFKENPYAARVSGEHVCNIPIAWEPTPPPPPDLGELKTILQRIKHHGCFGFKYGDKFQFENMDGVWTLGMRELDFMERADSFEAQPTLSKGTYVIEVGKPIRAKQKYFEATEMLKLLPGALSTMELVP